ncbi:MAG: type II CAAX endopeptidase family protein [Anaerolineaceae bacterium]|jgi:membrane protease YdiL (CAAX protease family)|nr:type II CAAX endopeptidase family protein [Anaerolineaceae bacterium]
MEIKNRSILNDSLPEGKFEFWRYLLLITLTIIVVLVTQAILLLIASSLEGTLDINRYPSMTLLWVTMIPFAALFVFLVPGIRLLHKQSIKTIFTQKSNFNWKLLFKSAFLWFVLSGLADIIISLIQPGNYVFSFSLISFLPYMLIAFILIAFQISAEEVLFRSYLLHGFTRLFRYRWLGIVIQAILFGVLHGANPEVSAYGLLTTMPFYIGIGLLLGWLSFKYLGLEIALGLHFANNFYATSMVTFAESAIPSPAIFTISNYQPETGLIAFVFMAFIFALIITKSKQITF